MFERYMAVILWPEGDGGGGWGGGFSVGEKEASTLLLSPKGLRKPQKKIPVDHL